MENLSSTKKLCIAAKAAVKKIATLDNKTIDRALLAMANAIEDAKEKILLANKKDVESARGTVSEVMIDRLKLTEERIRAMADGIRAIAALPSPLGVTIEKNTRPNGLLIEKVSVPMGVIAIIYESRPNVTSDAAALALKSGNVSILRGGKEAYYSSLAIVTAMKEGLASVGVCEDALHLVSDTTRESAYELMKASGYIDLLIPRGGAGLIRACVENSTVPCLETGTGICHIYVDAEADIEKALSIVENAKTSRPSVCNAMEVCLVNEQIATTFLPKLKERLCDNRMTDGLPPVRLKLCEKAATIIEGERASSTDFDTEFLDYVMAIKVVACVTDAIEHIGAHSTHHSEAIITENEEVAAVFTKEVDSAAVYVNASTRFTDGGEFGLGCEMGISTQKMHARGPLGIKELTTYKYIVKGNGQIR